jgi:1-acyl-sn-glycerol-3-phosphate acyltransferase
MFARLLAAALVLLSLTLATASALLVPNRAFRVRMARATVRGGCRALLASLGITRESRGPAPRTGTLLVANHLSWLDIPLALASWPCAFVAKREVRRWPLVGPLGEALGVIWIDRARPRDLLRVIPLVESALGGGHTVMLFPEGTTTDGRTIRSFRSGLFEAAVRAKATVTSVAFSAAATSRDPSALCWLGDETLVANLVRVAGLRGARLTVYVGPPVAELGDRKALARRSHAEAVKRFRPIRRELPAQAWGDAVWGEVSVRAKQNFRPIESSEREIFA